MSQSLNVLKSYGKLSVKREPLEVVSLTGAASLDAEDSGNVYILNLAAGFTVTLPDPETAKSGWNAEFIVGVAPTGNYVITTGSADILAVGASSEDAGGSSPSSGGTKDTNINFLLNASLPGDRVRVITDGTTYYASYQVSEIAFISLT